MAPEKNHQVHLAQALAVEAQNLTTAIERLRAYIDQAQP